jgi:UDPglucose 6-dehydrogenase
MKIGVIGGGTVGKAVARTYMEFVDEVRVYDEVAERRLDGLVPTIEESDLVFVCLPETRVEEFVRKYATSGYSDRNYVLKSTVPVGTTRRLREKYGLTNLVHSPEFITARCADTDARVPAVNVIGSPNRLVNDCEAIYLELLAHRFPGMGAKLMSSDESETLKLALNAFFGVKIGFFNELKEFCDKAGVDFETIRAGMLADGRITAHHTRVPGPDGKPGFGGACLPKDLKQFIHCQQEVHASTWITQAADTRNRRIDRKEGEG